MTTIGLNYVKHREDVRHNKVEEDIKDRTLDETIQANRNKEGLQRRDIAEKERTNDQNEKIKWAQLGEQKRKNKADEMLKLSDMYLDYLPDSTAASAVMLQEYDPATGNWYPATMGWDANNAKWYDGLLIGGLTSAGLFTDMTYDAFGKTKFNFGGK